VPSWQAGKPAESVYPSLEVATSHLTQTLRDGIMWPAHQTDQQVVEGGAGEAGVLGAWQWLAVVPVQRGPVWHLRSHLLPAVDHPIGWEGGCRHVVADLLRWEMHMAGGVGLGANAIHAFDTMRWVGPASGAAVRRQTKGQGDAARRSSDCCWAMHGKMEQVTAAGRSTALAASG
jgi:hypothetical protein